MCPHPLTKYLKSAGQRCFKKAVGIHSWVTGVLMWWHWQLTRGSWGLLTLGLYNFPYWYFSSWILLLLIILVLTTLPLFLIFLFLSFCRHSSVSQFNRSLGRLSQSYAANPCHPGWACSSAGGWTPQGGRLVTAQGEICFLVPLYLLIVILVG